MRSPSTMNAKPLILILSALALLTFLFLDHTRWSYLIGPMHNPGLGYPFADMQARLGMAQGVAEGIDVNHEPNPHVLSDRFNNKPLYTLHILSFLSIGSDDVVPMGVLFGCAFMLWNFYLLRPKRWLDLVLHAMILLSPPMLLLVNRGNDDIMIYSLILFAPLLLTMRSGIAQLAAWALISFLVPVKFFPAAAYSLFLYTARPRRFILITLGTLAYGCIIYLCIRNELESSLMERIPRPSLNSAIGASSIFQALGLKPIIAQTYTWLLLGGLTLSAAFFGLRARPLEPEEDSKAILYFILGFSLFAFCYVLNSNWDYRLAFLIPTIPLLTKWLHSKDRRLMCLSGLYLAPLLFVLWAEYIFFFEAFDRNFGWQFNKGELFDLLFIRHALSWITFGTGLHTLALLLFSHAPTIRALLAKQNRDPS